MFNPRHFDPAFSTSLLVEALVEVASCCHVDEPCLKFKVGAARSDWTSHTCKHVHVKILGSLPGLGFPCSDWSRCQWSLPSKESSSFQCHRHRPWAPHDEITCLWNLNCRPSKCKHNSKSWAWSHTAKSRLGFTQWVCGLHLGPSSLWHVPRIYQDRLKQKKGIRAVSWTWRCTQYFASKVSGASMISGVHLVIYCWSPSKMPSPKALAANTSVHRA